MLRRRLSSPPLVGLLAWVWLLGACAASPAEGEMIPVEQMVDYREVDEQTQPHAAQRLAGASIGPEEVRPECVALRQRYQSYAGAAQAAAGVSTLGTLFLVGADDTLVRSIGGVVAVAGTLAQAGAATGAQDVARRAVEQDCYLR